MNRRGFLASLLALLVARLLPKPKPGAHGLFNPKQNVAKLWAHHSLSTEEMRKSLLAWQSADAEWQANARFELHFLDNHWIEEKIR